MAIDALVAGAADLFGAGAAGAGAAEAGSLGAGAALGAATAAPGLGAADAALAGAGLGAADAGVSGLGAAGLGALGAGAGAGLTDITGTGTGLFGGTTGLEGTAIGGGFTGGVGGASGIGDLAGTGAGTAAGTAASFMGAPAASAFDAAAITPGAASFGGIPGAAADVTGSTDALPTFDSSGKLMGNLTSAQGQVPTTAGSAFVNGTTPVSGVSGTGAPGVASPFSAPTGVTAPDVGAIDPTAAAASGQGAGAATPAAPAAAPAAPVAPAAAPAASTDSGIMSTLKDYSGLAGVGLAGAGLANNLLNRNNVPGQAQVNAINSTIPQLQGMIQNVNQQAQKIANSTGPLDANTLQMLSYVNNGQLPPAMQAQIDNGVQAAKAAATSAMAARGMPSDPASNPQLASQLATIDSQALEMKGQLQNQLYQSGLQAWQASNQTQQVAGQLQQNALSATGLDLQTYMGLQNIYQNQSNQEQAAIGNLAQALGRMGTSGNNTLTIKTG